MAVVGDRWIDPADRESREIEILVRCSCGSRVGNLWGRPRSVVGGSVRTYPGWGGQPSDEDTPELGMPQGMRYRLVCRNKRCGREFVVTVEKLVVAGLDALDRPNRRERVVMLPDDIIGPLSMPLGRLCAPLLGAQLGVVRGTLAPVNEWRFVGR